MSLPTIPAATKGKETHRAKRRPLIDPDALYAILRVQRRRWLRTLQAGVTELRKIQAELEKVIKEIRNGGP